MTARPTARPSPPSDGATSKIVVPVRYAAWLSGDLGRTLERTLQHALDPLLDVRVTRLPRGFLIEANEEAGPLLEAVHRAALDLEKGVEAAYPVFHHEMGPVWTGTLQAVFDPPAAHA
ncbi:MAG: hypothetical protein QOJ26_809 [Thermoplasmata archaeon]|jgi:hypothetical protein|nr:hypothetical protein [Thermoplasmata archaeon]